MNIINSCRKGNSTVQQLLEMADTQSIPIPQGVGYERQYVVRYLGTLEVQQKSGQQIITMRYT